MKRRAILTRFVVDGWAWIEYFEGTLKGKKVKEIVENSDNDIFTHLMNVSEVASAASRKNMDCDSIIDVIISISSVYTGDEKFAANVGKRHAEIRRKVRDFGLIDACVLATAEKMNAKILTGDPHFNEMKNVVMLK